MPSPIRDCIMDGFPTKLGLKSRQTHDGPIPWKGFVVLAIK